MPNYSIKIINPTEYHNWDDEILKLDSYSFFHSSEWCKVLSETYKYTPTYFCILKANRLSSIIPAMEVKSRITGKRLVSLPFSDFCEPLFSSIDESEILKDSIFSYCKKNNFRYAEFRSSETKFPYETEHFRTDLRHILDISVDEIELQKHFSENLLRNIKAAIKEDVSIKERNTFEGIQTFYELQCITRKKHGLPPQPKSFFNNIHRFIISCNKGSILFAYHKDRPVASLMFFRIGDKVLYKFGASHTDNLPKGTNHLLMWEAIKIYRSKGFKEFDFGRTETNHEGLRRFKLGFGTDERIIYSTRYDIQADSFIQPESKTTGVHNKIIKRLPISILKLIGETVYKHMG